MRTLVIAFSLAAAASLAAHVAISQEAQPAAPQAAGGLATSTATCTGKLETDCGVTAGCAWLPGYKVANGVEVPGYCRAAPKPLSARRGSQLSKPQ